MTKVSNNAEMKTGRGSPWATALRILTRRDHSQAELRKRLSDKGFDAEQIETTLQRCLDLGYLDDARYALNRAASLMNQGRAVGHRVLADLRQRGVSDELAEQALAAAGKAPEAMIIGGANLYAQALPLAERMYLTLVHAWFLGDTRFPEYVETDWQLAESSRRPPDAKNPYACSFLRLERSDADGK